MNITVDIPNSLAISTSFGLHFAHHAVVWVSTLAFLPELLSSLVCWAEGILWVQAHWSASGSAQVLLLGSIIIVEADDLFIVSKGTIKINWLFLVLIILKSYVWSMLAAFLVVIGVHGEEWGQPITSVRIGYLRVSLFELISLQIALFDERLFHRRVECFAHDVSVCKLLTLHSLDSELLQSQEGLILKLVSIVLIPGNKLSEFLKYSPFHPFFLVVFDHFLGWSIATELLTDITIMWEIWLLLEVKHSISEVVVDLLLSLRTGSVLAVSDVKSFVFDSVFDVDQILSNMLELLSSLKGSEDRILQGDVMIPYSLHNLDNVHFLSNSSLTFEVHMVKLIIGCE